MKRGLAELQRQLEEHYFTGIRIPLDGREADAIQSVKDQLRNTDAERDDAKVEKLVREARQG